VRSLCLIAFACCALLANAPGALARATDLPCGAVTGTATDMTPTSATLNGTLGALSGGDAQFCGTWWFDYGPTSAYGTSTPATDVSGEGELPVSATITGVTPNTT
jgi:hypothetical protein